MASPACSEFGHSESAAPQLGHGSWREPLNAVSSAATTPMTHAKTRRATTVTRSPIVGTTTRSNRGPT